MADSNGDGQNVPPPGGQNAPESPKKRKFWEAKYVCPECGVPFRRRTELLDHRLSVHGNTRSVSALAYMNKRYLKKHPELNPVYRKSAAAMRQLERQRSARQLIDRDVLVRSAKKYTLLIVPVLIIVVVVIIYWYAYGQNSNSANYFNTYYGSYFNSFKGLISQLVGSIQGGIAYMNNPYGTGKPPVHVINTTQTFSSFLIPTSVSNQQLTMTDSPQLGTLLYSVKDNSNVPLGLDSNNNVLVSIGCGNTNSQQSARVCQEMFSSFVTPKKSSSAQISGIPLIPEMLPSETIENQTSFYFNCPSVSLTYPTGASMLTNFTVENYTAAAILPVEFISYRFSQKLLASSQALVPSTPSFDFVTPGPLQIKMGVSINQPVSTQVESVPISVTIENTGSGAYSGSYSISSLGLFINKQFYPNNPSNGNWQCSDAVSHTLEGFVFPGSGYWYCTLSSSQLGSPSSIFSLPAVTSLNGLHFNTMSIVASVTYNYSELLNMPFQVNNETAKCK